MYISYGGKWYKVEKLKTGQILTKREIGGEVRCRKSIMDPQSRKSAIRVGSGTPAKRCASKKHPQRPGGFGAREGGQGLKSRKRVFCIKILNPI